MRYKNCFNCLTDGFKQGFYDIFSRNKEKPQFYFQRVISNATDLKSQLSAALGYSIGSHLIQLSLVGVMLYLTQLK